MNFLYIAVQAPTEEMTDNMTFGVGYSLKVWNDLCIEPSYMMSTKEDSEGKFKEWVYLTNFSINLKIIKC